MGRFWIDDDFIRKDVRNLTPATALVFMGLCCHANNNGETFIGVRKLGEMLGLNKETVANAIQKLVVYGLVVQFRGGKGKVYGLTVKSVRIDGVKVYGKPVPKDLIKEVYKEEDLSSKKNEDIREDPLVREKAEAVKERIRNERGWTK